MVKIYSIGRSANADIRTPPEHDAVGKMHAEIEKQADGRVRVTDRQSTNGTFVRTDGNWVEIKTSCIVEMDAELMLADFCTTPRKLLASVEKIVADAPVRRRAGPRRNEFGEIILE